MRFTPALVLLLATACTGTIEGGGNPQTVDAGGGGGSGTPADAAPIPTQRVAVAGTLTDYYSGVASDGVVTTEGVTPASTSTAPATGAFSVEVPTGLPFGLVVSKVGARTTHHGTRTTTAALAGVALHVTSSQQTSVQYGAVGLTATLGTAVVYVNLVDNLGAPLVGVPTGDITLVDLAGAPVPGVQGPFFFSAIGNLTRNLEQSTAFAGKARVGFLDCPPGTYNVVVDTQLGGGPFTVPVTCLADGAALAQTGLLP